MKVERKALPTKRSVNLVIRRNTRAVVERYAVAIVIFAVLLALFAKFAVIDRLALVRAEERKAKALEQQMADLQESIADYDEVLRQYQHYYPNSAQNALAESLACSQVLDLLEDTLLYETRILAVDYSGQTLKVAMAGADLNRLSVLMTQLEAQDSVSSVSLTTAAAKDEQEPVAYLTIALITEGGDGK